jgi:hypothetical protein
MTRAFSLQSVTVDNFKAVHRSGPVTLTPLTVFIGNNGSGKSSLVEALETYRAIVLDRLEDRRRADDPPMAGSAAPAGPRCTVPSPRPRPNPAGLEGTPCGGCGGTGTARRPRSG